LALGAFLAARFGAGVGRSSTGLLAPLFRDFLFARFGFGKGDSFVLLAVLRILRFRDTRRVDLGNPVSFVPFDFFPAFAFLAFFPPVLGFVCFAFRFLAFFPWDLWVICWFLET
jgi:hypothetical protein